MTSEQIVIQAGAEWVGLQSGKLVLFREPQTGSTCSLLESGLTVAAVEEKMQSKRREFGLLRFQESCQRFRNPFA
jgi:hypothetical protein